MDYMTREEAIRELQKSMSTLMEHFQLDDIGVYEEQGPHEQYYMGYTINKDGKTYMIHKPYTKNSVGHLASTQSDWTVETDEPITADVIGFKDVEDALQHLT